MSLRRILSFVFLLIILQNTLISEVMDLDTFLKKTLIHFRQKELNDEFLKIMKEGINVNDTPKLKLSNRIEKKRDFLLDEETNRMTTDIDYSQKTKFGTSVSASIANSGNTKDKELLTSYRLSVSQSLFKNLLAKFYDNKKSELNYKSQELKIKLFEDYILESALQAYLSYCDRKKTQKEIDNSLEYLQKYIYSLKENAKSSLVAKIILTDLEIEKNNKILQKRDYALTLLDRKIRLAAFVGEDINNVEFSDSSLIEKNPIDRYIAYQESILTKEEKSERLKLKMLEINIKESKNELHPYVSLFADAFSEKKSKKFFNSFDHFKDTRYKSYSIGIKTGITLFDRSDKLQIARDRYNFKKKKQYLNNFLTERHNILFALHKRKEIAQTQEKLMDEQIRFVEKQLKLQYKLVENKITSSDTNQKDSDYEVKKLIEIINRLEYYKIRLFRLKINTYNRYIDYYKVRL